MITEEEEINETENLSDEIEKIILYTEGTIVFDDICYILKEPGILLNVRFIFTNIPCINIHRSYKSTT